MFKANQLMRWKQSFMAWMQNPVDLGLCKEIAGVEEFYRDSAPKGWSKKIIVKKTAKQTFKVKSLVVLTELVAVLKPFKLKKNIGHPFHLVTPSVLPFTMSLAFLCVFQNFLGFMWFEGWHILSVYQYHALFFANFFAVILTWILEVFKEEQSGAHTVEIQKGFQYAILLFILSELMLFFSFFWAYFHFTLNSNSFTGGTYVPEGLVVFFWYRIPLLNTLLLLASGLSLTIGHILLVESDKLFRLKIWVKLLANMSAYRVLKTILNIGGKNSITNNKKLTLVKAIFKSIKRNLFWARYENSLSDEMSTTSIRYSKDGLSILPKAFLLKYKNTSNSIVFTPTFWVLDTVLKGFVFLMYQAYEYTSSMFAINDSVYGAVFFSLTGLHGLHVFVGVMFLLTFVLVTLAREFDEEYISYRENDSKNFTKIENTFEKYNSSYSVKYYSHRIAFDGAAWYWHFVDVVWLFVFIFVYWWGFAG